MHLQNPLSIPKWLSLSVVLALLCGCAREPDYRTLAGEAGTFAALQGQWVVVNYWAIWCKPCIEEIPELNAFAAAHPDDVTVFGVNFDGVTGEQLGEQAGRLGIAFPVLISDPGPQLGLPRPEALPTTFVIDPTGLLSATLRGPQTLEDLNAAIGASQPDSATAH